MSASDDGRLRVGVVGTSKRAALYFRQIPADLEQAVRITALADPNPSKRAKFQELLCHGYEPEHYTSAADMLAAQELDVLVIATPNKFHADDAELALSKGITTLLEKPIAVSAAECRRLWKARPEAEQASLAVGFVLRYTPFYSKVKEIIESGGIGDVLAIEADERLGTAQTSAFHRGWRKHDDVAGSFILEKCSHDFDMLNWMVGADVTRVFSIGHRTHFLPQPKQGERHSRYNTVDRPRYSADYGDNQIREAFFTPIEGSPYDVHADSPDHQAVMLEYAQGTLCTFTVTMAQPRTTRSIRVFGTDGSLEGDIGHSRITIYRPHQSGDGHDVEEITVEHDTSGHNGGDSVIGESFWRSAATGTSALTRAGLKEGIEAVLISLAAEESRRTGLPIEIEPLRREVYGSTGGVAAGGDA